MAKEITFEVFNEDFADKVVGRKGKRGIDGYLGIEVTELTAGHLVAEFDARDELITPIGNMHGGCLSAFVDHCLGVIMYPVMPPGYWAATTEFKVNMLSPVSGGLCIATADIRSMTSCSGGPHTHSRAMKVVPSISPHSYTWQTFWW